MDNENKNQDSASSQGKVQTNTKPSTTKEDDVSLPKKTLQAILDRIDSLEADKKSAEERDKKRDTEIEMLKSISDKARLARYESLNKGSLIHTAKVPFWEGMPILAWSRGRDEVGFRDGKLMVNQTIKFFVDEGNGEPTLKELDYLYWAQNVDTQIGEISEKLETPTGTYYTMLMKDGRKIKVDIRFLNAF